MDIRDQKKEGVEQGEGGGPPSLGEDCTGRREVPDKIGLNDAKEVGKSPRKGGGGGTGRPSTSGPLGEKKIGRKKKDRKKKKNKVSVQRKKREIQVRFKGNAVPRAQDENESCPERGNPKHAQGGGNWDPKGGRGPMRKKGRNLVGSRTKVGNSQSKGGRNERGAWEKRRVGGSRLKKSGKGQPALFNGEEKQREPPAGSEVSKETKNISKLNQKTPGEQPRQKSKIENKGTLGKELKSPTHQKKRKKKRIAPGISSTGGIKERTEKGPRQRQHKAAV